MIPISIFSMASPHLAETQTAVPPVPAWELSIHALLVLRLQLLVHPLIFLPCGGNRSFRNTMEHHGSINICGWRFKRFVFATGKLTATEVGRRLVVTNDDATSVLLLGKKQKQHQLLYRSALTLSKKKKKLKNVLFFFTELPNLGGTHQP